MEMQKGPTSGAKESMTIYLKKNKTAHIFLSNVPRLIVTKPLKQYLREAKKKS